MPKSKTKKIVAKKLPVKKVVKKVAKKSAKVVTKKIVTKKPVAKKKVIARKVATKAKPAEIRCEVFFSQNPELLLSKLSKSKQDVTTPAYSTLFQSVAVSEVEPDEEKLDLMQPGESIVWKQIVTVVGVSVMTLLIGVFWIQITKGYFQSIDDTNDIGLTEQIKARVSQDLNSLAPEAKQFKEKLGEAAQKIQEAKATTPSAPTN